MSITREEVAKIASLARIRMDEAELDRMVPELNNILGWVGCATMWSMPIR